MPFPLKALTIIVPLLAAPLLMAGTAAAQSNERCTGTLCDLYYGGAPASAPQPAAKPAAPTPIMVPSGGVLGFFSKGGSAQNTAPSDVSGTPASGLTSRVHVGGGGLLGLARGETPDRCSGTICDLYYGGPPPEKPAPATAAAPAPETPDAIADAPADEPRASRRRARVEFVESEEKPGCAPTPQDPWRCYRK